MLSVNLRQRSFCSCIVKLQTLWKCFVSLWCLSRTHCHAVCIRSRLTIMYCLLFSWFLSISQHLCTECALSRSFAAPTTSVSRGDGNVIMTTTAVTVQMKLGAVCFPPSLFFHFENKVRITVDNIRLVNKVIELTPRSTLGNVYLSWLRRSL